MENAVKWQQVSYLFLPHMIWYENKSKHNWKQVKVKRFDLKMAYQLLSKQGAININVKWFIVKLVLDFNLTKNSDVWKIWGKGGDGRILLLMWDQGECGEVCFQSYLDGYNSAAGTWSNYKRYEILVIKNFQNSTM